MDIKALRLSSGMTQSELATVVGVSRNYIAMIESGRREPSRHLLSSINEACNNANKKVITSDNNLPDTSSIRHITTAIDDMRSRLSTIEQLLLRLVAEKANNGK